MKKNEKKIKKLKKGKLSIKELNVIQTAYFNELSKLDYIKMVGLQGLAFGAVGFLIFQNKYGLIIGLCIGCIFGIAFHLPNSIRKNYFLRSYVERNRFINNFTQLIINQNLPLLDIIEKIIQRLEGELYNDMTVLLARITSADERIAKEAFSVLSKKYEDDVVFGQYIEQIETVFIEGIRNINSFKELKTQHNIYFEELQNFQKDKNKLGSEFVFTLGLVGLLIIIFSVGLGIENYQEVFINSSVGIICCSIFSVNLLYQYVKSMKYIYDDSISKL